MDENWRAQRHQAENPYFKIDKGTRATEVSYKTKDKVKRNARKDRRRDFIAAMTREVEEAAGEMRVVFKITSQLCGTTISLNTQVKDKQSNILTTDEEQAKRWVEHFNEVLNCADPSSAANQHKLRKTLILILANQQ